MGNQFIEDILDAVGRILFADRANGQIAAHGQKRRVQCRHRDSTLPGGVSVIEGDTDNQRQNGQQKRKKNDRCRAFITSEPQELRFPAT